MVTRSSKLLDHLRGAIGLNRYPYSTEKAYVDWAKRCFRFYNKRHPT